MFRNFKKIGSWFNIDLRAETPRDYVNDSLNRKKVEEGNRYTFPKLRDYGGVGGGRPPNLETEELNN